MRKAKPFKINITHPNAILQMHAIHKGLQLLNEQLVLKKQDDPGFMNNEFFSYELWLKCVQDIEQEVRTYIKMELNDGKDTGE